MGGSSLALNRRCQQHDYCGCEAAACCLGCPLAYCRFEESDLRSARRRTHVLELHRQGLVAADISRTVKVDPRTVYKDLSALRKRHLLEEQKQEVAHA